MYTTLMLIADAPPPETLGQAVDVLVTGVTLVFAALVMVMGMIVAIRKMSPEEGAGGGAPASKSSSPPAAKPAAPADDSIDGATLAVIAAAVLVAVKQPVRITRVRFVKDQWGRAAWAQRGRSEIHSSHRLRKG